MHARHSVAQSGCDKNMLLVQFWGREPEGGLGRARWAAPEVSSIPLVALVVDA